MSLTLNIEIALNAPEYTTMLQSLEEIASAVMVASAEPCVMVFGTKGTVIKLCQKVDGEVVVERLGEL